MRNFYKQFVLYILTFAILASLCGCDALDPPDIASVEERFTACYDDIMLIVEYLSSMEYDVVEIETRTYRFGKISVMNGLKSEDIKVDSTMKDVVKRLMKGGYKYICKSGNTIEFCHWHRFRDASCGIAYSINGVSEPEIQYVVELTPLDQMGWYYYVVDVDVWRVEKDKTGDGSLSWGGQF